MALSAAELTAFAQALEAVLAQPEAQRAAWLAAQTQWSPALAAQVAAALARAASSPWSLPGLAAAGADDALGEAADARALQPEAVVGGYRLARELGRGGMGAVWLAERADGLLRRPVALKLPHTSLPRALLAERFGRERDILAALTHPHIARLYDAGVTPDGRPYLALEYVEGQTLTDYCHAHALDLNARLALFMQVLDAVQYAHGQLVVHRDLKPSNILVSQDGHVHLLDFGIAKLLVPGHGTDPAPDLTQAGGRALTLQYAAPEQILGRPIGIAADVYALGVVLYELLCGGLPYQPRRASRGALEDAIVDAEPPLPSQAARALPWGKALRGDLDTIVLKALRKAPEARYATVNALADDLERYRRGDAVLARPASVGYRLGKFLRRYRWGVAATALTVGALAGGLGVALWQAQIAREEAATARAVEGFLTGIFLANSAQQPDPERARQTTARELLDIGAAQLDHALADAPRARARMLGILVDLYSHVGLDARAAEFAQAHIDAQRALGGPDSLALADALLAAYAVGSDPPHGPSRLGAWLDEAEAILQRRGDTSPERYGMLRLRQAWFLSHRDFARANAYAIEAATLLQGTPRAAVAYKAASVIARQAGECARALQLARQGVAVHAPVRDELPGLLLAVADAQWCLGEREAALRALDQGVEAAHRVFGATDTVSIIVGARLAERTLQQGGTAAGRARLADLEAAMQRRPAGEADWGHWLAQLALGRAALAAGDARSALRYFAFMDVMRPYDASPAIAEMLRDRARAQMALGQHDAAHATLARAIAVRTRAGVDAGEALAEERALQSPR